MDVYTLFFILEAWVTILSCCLRWCGLNKPHFLCFGADVFSYSFLYSVPFSADDTGTIVDSVNNCIVCIVGVIDALFENILLHFILLKCGYLCECVFRGLMCSYVLYVFKLTHANFVLLVPKIFLRLDYSELDSCTIQRLSVNAVSNWPISLFFLLSEVFDVLVCFANAFQCFNELLIGAL